MQNASLAQQQMPQLNPQQLLERSLAKVLYFLSQPLPADMDMVTNFASGGFDALKQFHEEGKARRRERRNRWKNRLGKLF